MLVILQSYFVYLHANYQYRIKIKNTETKMKSF